MINLHELFDGAILNTLRDRYNANKIYTNISSIVIAVNPYQQLPLFTPEIQQAYHNKETEEPHVYVLAGTLLLPFTICCYILPATKRKISQLLLS